MTNIYAQKLDHNIERKFRKEMIAFVGFFCRRVICPGAPKYYDQRNMIILFQIL